MPTTVKIPGGEAVLREPEEMRGRDRLVVKAAAVAASAALAKVPDGVYEERPGESSEDRDKRLREAFEDVDWDYAEALAIQELRQATVVARLVSWTLPEPLPTMGTIGDLPGDLYDALVEAAGGEVSLGTDFEATPDRDRPTGGSNDSAGLSTGAAETVESTPTQPNGGESTATASSTPA